MISCWQRTLVFRNVVRENGLWPESLLFQCSPKIAHSNGRFAFRAFHLQQWGRCPFVRLHWLSHSMTCRPLYTARKPGSCPSEFAPPTPPPPNSAGQPIVSIEVGVLAILVRIRWRSIIVRVCEMGSRLYPKFRRANLILCYKLQPNVMCDNVGL